MTRSSARAPLGSFDFVYSAGLFDYLDQSSACKLLKKMLSMTAHEGRLMITNFMPQVRDAGYMESFVGWKLLYRTVDDLARWDIP